MAVDGHETRGNSLGDTVMRIRGRPESQVTLTLQRGDQTILVVVRRKAMTKSGGSYAGKK